jgi:hypothetical protein
MKLSSVKTLLILLACCSLVLLSGCGTNQGSTGTSPATTSTAPTAMATPTATASPATSTTPGVTCQVSPTVDLNAVAPLSQSAVFYINSKGGYQVSEYGSMLKRYNLATGQTTTLLDYSVSRTGILSAQLSPDKRWLAVQVTQATSLPALVKLLLIGVDGTHLQTLDCRDTSNGFVMPGNTIAWSPNSQELAYDTPFSAGQKGGVGVLNLATGSETVFQVDASPFAWLDNQHLLVRNDSGYSLVMSSEKIFLLDTSQGPTQQPQLIASAPALCAPYVLSSDGQKLYSATCTLKVPNGYNCRSSLGIQGAGSLNVQSASGGSPGSLYSANNLGILAIQPVGTSILFYSYGAINDGSQSGLWARDSAGHLTHLINGNVQNCLIFEGSEDLPALTSNGTSYALYTSSTSATSLAAIQVGSISGGSPSTIATLSPVSGVLHLVGMG